MTLSKSAGCVYVVATPIGNLDDLSPRAVRVLREASVLACEDTRRTARLCAHFGIGTPRVSLHAYNEKRRLPELLRRLEAGEAVALVSDAGTPLLSDPGARFVRAALEGGFRVVPIPGPSAILAGLVASGLPTRPFTFVGFLPRKGRARADWLDRLRTLPGSIVLFEAPGRVNDTLRDLHKTLGPRPIAVARELTKRFEEILRGRLGELDLPELRGEVTLVVEGCQAEAAHGAEEVLVEEAADVQIASLLEEGHSTRDAARELARRLGISRTEAYRRVLERVKKARAD